MYVVQTDACSVRNSTTPVSPGKIARGQQILGRMNARAVTAQNAFTALLCRQDLNTNGWPLVDMGGTPSACGTEGALPIGGNVSSIATWPAQLVFYPVAPGVAPATLQAYSAPPAPPMPSLVTQGHPRYDPQTKKVVNAPVTAPTVKHQRQHRAAQSAPSPLPSTALAPNVPGGGWQDQNVAPAFCEGIPQGKPGYTQCLSAQGIIAAADAGNISASDAAATKAAFAQIIQQQGKGMGSVSGVSCDFLTGMVSAIGLGAAVLYLFDYLKRSGRISL